MLIKRIYIATAVLLAVFLLASCSITTAPTGTTSDTVGNTTDASSDLTSSTSAGDDDEDSAEAAVVSFVSSNASQLRSDMATGSGEYLTSYAILLGISEAEREGFYALTRAKFDEIFISSDTSAEDVVENTRNVIDDNGLEISAAEESAIEAPATEAN